MSCRMDQTMHDDRTVVRMRISPPDQAGPPSADRCSTIGPPVTSRRATERKGKGKGKGKEKEKDAGVSRRTVSRVLCPLRGGDHLSRTPVSRRLERHNPRAGRAILGAGLPTPLAPSYSVLLRAGFAW